MLARLTDEVAGLVLRNNYLQGQALSMLELQSAQRLPELQGLVRDLERRGDLNRAVEHLPDDEGFTQRRKQDLGLTRPELAVLLSYSKIWLTRQLLASDLPEDPGFAGELMRYFPKAVGERYPTDIRKHRLRREIIATAVTNSLVNRMGPTFVGRACAETGASAADVARAWGIARQVFGARDLWGAVESLDHRIPAAGQYAVLGDSARLLRHATVWLLRRRRDRLAVDAAVKEYTAPIAQLRAALPRVLAGASLEAFEAARARHVSAGVPTALAETAAGLPMLDAALEICEIARGAGLRVEDAALAWSTASSSLGLDRLEARIEALAVDGPLQATARAGLRDALRNTQARILTQLLSGGARRGWETRWQDWRTAQAARLEDWQRTTREVFALGNADFAALSVCVEALRSLAE
jgi:glutamate dehydrogenase